MHLDASNFYGWAMSQNIPVNGFAWLKKLSKSDERFIKNYDENSDKGYLNIQNICSMELHSMKLHSAELRSTELHPIFIVIYHFYAKEIKLKNIISLFVTYIAKKTMLCIYEL